MFGKKKRRVPVPETSVTYPVGTVVRTPSGVWYLKKTLKLKITSDRVLKTWNFQRIVETSDAAIAGYKNAGILGLREGTYFIDTSTNERFIISEGKKRLIQNPDWFDLLGLDPATPLWVSKSESDMHSLGEVLK